jgi:thioesterase domain-containing protein/acyl carrier protein
MEEMRIYLKKHLPDYMVPSVFITLNAMPQTATGKIDRLKLPKLEEVLNLEKDYVPPRDDYERRLIQIWEELFEMAPIGIKNDFFQLGGHSLLAADLVTKIEETFGKRIDLARLTEAPTIEKLAVVLKSVSEVESRPVLVPIRESGKKPPLFCVHGVGGHILPFLLLAQYLGEDIPVYGLQSKGIQDRTEADNTIEGMAAAYIQEIRSVQPSGPYYIAGFSFGGFVAYEMARQLLAEGQTVDLLAILDTHAGAAPRFLTGLTRLQKVSYRTKSLLEKMRFQVQNLKQKSPKEIVAYLRRREAAPDVREAIMGDVEEEQVPDYMMAIIRANARALQTYQPQRFPGKITLFRSIEHGKGVYYGWGELASGGVEVFDVPGNHRGILQEPNVRLLAEKLRACFVN